MPLSKKKNDPRSVESSKQDRDAVRCSAMQCSGLPRKAIRDPSLGPSVPHGPTAASGREMQVWVQFWAPFRGLNFGPLFRAIK